MAETPYTHNKVLWLNVSMKDSLLMNPLNPLQNLYPKHENRLKAESPPAPIEELL